MHSIEPSPNNETVANPNGGDAHLEGQIKILREMVMKNHQVLVSIRRQMRLSTIFSILRLLLVLIPLIIAAIYLPPFIRDALNYYSQFSAATSPSATKLDLTDLQDLLQSAGIFQK